ncbi:MAG: hypothetical protein C0521_12270 [Xanthomonas sp.]|nr:hypothetical protein [Xanthomonas sp.]
MRMSRQAIGFARVPAVSWRWPAVLLAALLSGCIDGGGGADLHTPVRYELAGYRYEIPLAYHYGEAIKRRGRWPNPKTEFSRVGAISITALLPGIRPYDDSVRDEFERLGYGNKIHLMIRPPGSLYPMDEWLRRMNSTGRLTPLASELDGLTRYWDNHTGQDESKGDDVYIREGEGYFMLRCPRMVAPSPACSVTRTGRDGVEIDYSFSTRHLMSWRQIDRDVDARIDEFRATRNKPVPAKPRDISP